MTRDSQKSRVYEAERAIQDTTHAFRDGRVVWTTLDPWTIEQCQEFVDKIVGSKWWANKGWRTTRVYVRHGRGGGQANGSIIWLGVWARQPVVILHELSHVVCGRLGKGYRPHGRTFCRVMLALTRRWMGVEVEGRLKKSYDEHGVLWRLPRGGGTTPPRCPACHLFMGAEHDCPERDLTLSD